MTEIAKVEGRNDESWRPLFLRVLRNTATIRAAAEMVGVTTHKVRAAMRLDPAFATLVNDSLLDAAELLEGTAFQRALAGDNLMTIFLLKGMKPDTYRENLKGDNKQTNVHIKTYVGWDPDTWDKLPGNKAPTTIDVVPETQQIEQRVDPDLSVPSVAMADSTAA